MIQSIIQTLVEGNPVTREEAAAAMRDIMSGEASEAQIGAFIAATRLRGITPELVAGCAEVMRENATPVPCSDPAAVDLVGTGGDGAHTFNISTTAAFVAAGAGATVAKHGSYGVYSRCGSANVLQELGINLQYGPDRMAQCLEEIGIAFLFAPALHPAMKQVVGPRRELGIWSIFNILGPLCNPAGVKNAVIGVFSESLIPLVAEAGRRLNMNRLLVVHGRDGLDEITTTAPTTLCEIDGEEVRNRTIRPEDFGLERAAPEALTGGDPAENAEITRAILNGGDTGPRRDIVLLNAAHTLLAAGRVETVEDGLREAAGAIESGAAAEKLRALAELSRD